jgi:hypothetical protein
LIRYPFETVALTCFVKSVWAGLLSHRRNFGEQ